MSAEPPLKNGHGDDKTDTATIAVEAAPEGRMRVGAAAWEDARVILNGEVLELRNMDGRIRVARTTREPDDLNVPVPVCAPMDPAPTTSAPPSDASRSERNALQPAALRVTERGAMLAYRERARRLTPLSRRVFGACVPPAFRRRYWSAIAARASL